jgi:hypothetical protein
LAHAEGGRGARDMPAFGDLGEDSELIERHDH